MKVLVVEDSVSMRNFLGFSLSVFQYSEVEYASDGITAISKLESDGDFDIVLCGTKLPRMGGMRFLHALREKTGKTSEIPVVLVTADKRKQLLNRALELNAYCVLTKPVQPHEIRNAVCGALGQAVTISPHHEKRRCPRVELKIDVFLGEPINTTFKSWDISPYGAFLVATKPPTVGTATDATLQFPHLEAPFTCQCRIVHVRTQPIGSMPRGFGVNFDHDSKETSTLLFSAFASPETMEE